MTVRYLIGFGHRVNNNVWELDTEPNESRKIGVEATKAAMLSVHGERRNCLTQLSTGMIRLYRCPNE
jgi:hypothetical protein